MQIQAIVPEISYEMGAIYVLLLLFFFLRKKKLIFKMCIEVSHSTYMLILIVKLFTVNGSRYSTSF